MILFEKISTLLFFEKSIRVESHHLQRLRIIVNRTWSEKNWKGFSGDWAQITNPNNHLGFLTMSSVWNNLLRPKSNILFQILIFKCQNRCNTSTCYPPSKTSQMKWGSCRNRLRMTWEHRGSFSPHAVVSRVV